MIECIADDGIFGSKDGLEKSGIRIESTGEQDAIFKLIIVGYGFLQLLVDILSSADESDWAHPETVRIESFLGSLN